MLTRVRRACTLCAAGALLLVSATPSSAQSGTLRGRVVDAATGEPVVGAVIRVSDGDETVSSSEGFWRFGDVGAGERVLVIEHIGYATERVRVTADASAEAPRIIRLTPRALALDAMVVTASRRLQPLKDVPVATELIGAAELRQTGASDLASVLVERTGITLEGGHPVGAGVMLQGLGSERVLVLMDGQPMVGRLSGKMDLSRIPTSMIERVEVVKGAQSTLYGTDAMGGVINVITRAAAQGALRGAVDVTGGTAGRLDISANAIGGVGEFGFAADGGRRLIELVPGLNSDAATYAERRDAALKTRWHAHPDLSFSASASMVDERQRWKSGVLYNFADNLQWSGRGGAEWQRGAHRLAPTIYATEFRHHSRRSTLPQPVAGSGDTEAQRLYEAELMYTYDADDFVIDAGVEARREEIRSDRVQNESRALYAAEPFAQTTVSGDRWSVVPGVRMSWSEQWGGHWTPRLAAMFRPTDRVALRASVGSGFRAPAFKELYMEFLNTGAGAGYRVRGNAELQPETSRSANAGIEWSGDRIYARTQLYYNRFTDFIETRELPDSAGLRLFTYGNVDDGYTTGADVEAGATWRGFRVETGYGYLVARDRNSGTALLGRPTHSARGTVAYAAPRGLRASLSTHYSGSAPVSRTNEELVTRKGVAKLDARVGQQFARGIEITLGIDNVLDTQPANWPGFLGRQAYLGLGWRSDDR